MVRAIEIVEVGPRDGLQNEAKIVSTADKVDLIRRAIAAGAKRIGVVTPYQPIGDKNVVRFFGDIGFDVVKIKGLRCPTAVSIAHVSENDLRKALIEVNGPDIDALVQALRGAS